MADFDTSLGPVVGTGTEFESIIVTDLGAAQINLTAIYRIEDAPEQCIGVKQPCITTWESDDFSLRVLISRSDDELPLDLTEASIEAVYGRGGHIIPATVEVFDPTSGIFVASIEPYTLKPRMWNFQVRVTIGDVIQTVLDTDVRVEYSFDN